MAGTNTGVLMRAHPKGEFLAKSVRHALTRLPSAPVSLDPIQQRGEAWARFDASGVNIGRQ
jgi:hypothetical protein